MEKTIKPTNAFTTLSGSHSLFDSSVMAFAKAQLGNISDLTFLPGFCDVHVHFREPGFSYKGTIKDGTRSAAKGGYTAVCTMPNLNPVPDNREHLGAQLQLIRRDACISVYPYGSITKGELGKELSDMDELKDDVIAFSDDGRGVRDEGIMLEAMAKAKSLGKMIVAHCEFAELVNGGYIHDGEYARAHGHKGICSESEFREIERDIKLAQRTGCAFHVCHISCKESVSLIRDAKKSGVDITCETAPHYLILTQNDLKEDGAFKMNPPLRSVADRDALIGGVEDGTIDMIATDHAPHTREEKSRGLKDSPFGIVGIETAFPLLYTYLVKRGVISLDRLTELISYNPKKRFKIADKGWSAQNLNEEFTVRGNDFLSRGKVTPFEGTRLFGVNYLTVMDGKVLYKKN